MNRKIGLKRGTVRLAPHAAEWSSLYEEERARLEGILSGLPAAFEHVGSTAIPGLEAKPIIDLALGIPSLDKVEEYIRRLEPHGYHDRGALPGEDRLLARGPEECRTHYVHIVEFGGKKWQEYILFRDYMRTHPKAREEYAGLKEVLADQYADEREKYTAGKHDFIQHILELARRAKTRRQAK
jgi:GrpB-like predicted nucleotidyltransferase (UPF0157 family)